MKASIANAVGVPLGTSRSERVKERNSGPKIIAMTKTHSQRRQMYRLYFSRKGK